MLAVAAGTLATRENRMSADMTTTSGVDPEQLSQLSEIIERVAGVPAAEVSPEKSLVEDLGLDSLAIVAVVFALEESTSGDIPEESLAGAVTVGDLLLLASQASSQN
ncbi:acyl carrier protein [Solwaraspora sp. WMMD1047]|uniref:acyl carrier protein n=1 Tax=Solwaraspora sp. WMMD1047 TaxID=3016102 RepID=UPI002416C3D9|nr:acyl carrier protein [Solwaraspora sp. WMMD1047]MDG4827806.1 acyl carrier protein [Solwaraspora sp. WMMD1047]